MEQNQQGVSRVCHWFISRWCHQKITSCSDNSLNRVNVGVSEMFLWLLRFTGKLKFFTGKLLQWKQLDFDWRCLRKRRRIRGRDSRQKPRRSRRHRSTCNRNIRLTATSHTHTHTPREGWSTTGTWLFPHSREVDGNVQRRRSDVNTFYFTTVLNTFLNLFCCYFCRGVASSSIPSSFQAFCQDVLGFQLYFPFRCQLAHPVLSSSTLSSSCVHIPRALLL